MKVKQSVPFAGIEEYEAIRDCFVGESWLSEGLKSKQFVEKLCEMLRCKYAVLSCNGTTSLYMALKSLGIGEGDEVIIPNHTFVASCTSVIMAGATPVFVDCGKDLQISMADCERSGVLSGKTKAIMPVHLWGSVANMDEVLKFAKKHDFLVVEDACQGLCVEYNGQPVGTFGDTAAFSFFADKSITSGGEGGLVVAKEEKIYEELLYLRNQGRKDRGSFQHDRIGFNFRMTDIQSAVGLAQLTKSEYIFRRRQENYKLYCELLNDVEEVRILQPSEKTTLHIPFRCVMFVEGEQIEMAEWLKQNEIETRTLFFPLHQQPCFAALRERFDYRDEDFPNSINAYRHGLCLPVHPSLTEEQIRFVCEKIKEYYARK